MFDTVVQMLPEVLLYSSIAGGDYSDALLPFKVNACASCSEVSEVHIHDGEWC